MMATLEWVTLAVCCAALLLRVPDALRGRNRTVFGILLLATLCSLLAVSELYAIIDGALGGWGATSLILRFLVFATVLLVGLRVTRGLGAASGYKLISGGIGRWALGLGCLAVTVTFFPMHTYGTPAGLQAPSAGGPDASPAGSLQEPPPAPGPGRRTAGPVRRLLRSPEPAGLFGPAHVGRRTALRQLRRGPGLRPGPCRLLVLGLISDKSGNAKATLRKNRD